MPDFLAGQRLTALHFPPTVGDTQDGNFTCDSTVFGIDADSGTYLDCGTAFLGPFTGRVLIHYAADLDNDTGAASTNVAPVVREGGTVGSGATVLAASLSTSVRNVGTTDNRFGATYLLEGLTPGDTYNVRLEHRVSGGTGTIEFRSVSVEPGT